VKKILNYKDKGIENKTSGLIEPDVYKTILDNVPVACVDLVIIKNNKVFLIKRKNKPCKGVYWLQGGRMFKNEEIEHCGIRKAASELNIAENKIKITKYLGTFSTQFSDSEQSGTASHTINITFQAEIEDIPVGFDDDHSDGKWFDINGSIPDELKNKYTHHPYISEILKMIGPAELSGVATNDKKRTEKL